MNSFRMLVKMSFCVNFNVPSWTEWYSSPYIKCYLFIVHFKIFLVNIKVLGKKAKNNCTFIISVCIIPFGPSRLQQVKNKWKTNIKPLKLKEKTLQWQCYRIIIHKFTYFLEKFIFFNFICFLFYDLYLNLHLFIQRLCPNFMSSCLLSWSLVKKSVLNLKKKSL